MLKFSSEKGSFRIKGDSILMPSNPLFLAIWRIFSACLVMFSLAAVDRVAIISKVALLSSCALSALERFVLASISFCFSANCFSFWVSYSFEISA